MPMLLATNENIKKQINNMARPRPSTLELGYSCAAAQYRKRMLHIGITAKNCPMYILLVLRWRWTAVYPLNSLHTITATHTEREKEGDLEKVTTTAFVTYRMHDGQLPCACLNHLQPQRSYGDPRKINTSTLPGSSSTPHARQRACLPKFEAAGNHGCVRAQG